jgi:hypothetical protein
MLKRLVGFGRTARSKSIFSPNIPEQVLETVAS